MASHRIVPLALLLFASQGLLAGETAYLGFTLTATPVPQGGAYLRFAPGPLVRHGIRVVSEPSGTTLAVISTLPFEKTAEGREWIRQACAAAAADCSVASVSPFDGVRHVQLFVKDPPSGDGTLALFVRGFEIPAGARPAGLGDEYVFRTSFRRLSSTVTTAFYAVAPAGEPAGPLDYTEICCYEEGHRCRNCQRCKYGDTTACCLNSEGDQSCGGGNWGCNHSKATCGDCALCGP